MTAEIFERVSGKEFDRSYFEGRANGGSNHCRRLCFLTDCELVCRVFFATFAVKRFFNAAKVLLHRIRNPLQVLRASTLNFNRNTFRQFVRMQFAYRRLHLALLGLHSLDDQQELLCRLHLALPSVNRRNSRHDVYARGQPALHQRRCNFPGLGVRCRSGEDQQVVRHMKSPSTLSDCS